MGEHYSLTNYCSRSRDAAYLCGCKLCKRTRDRKSYERIRDMRGYESSVGWYDIETVDYPDKVIPVPEGFVNSKYGGGALSQQEGGSHYKDMKVQPIEYCMANNLNPCQTHMIKYVSRYPNKNGAEDLRKVIHLAKLALQIEYGESYE